MMSREELAAWLRLAETPALGRSRARRLLAAFGSPERALGAGAAALAAVIGAGAAGTLLAPHRQRDALPDATWRWLHAAPASTPRDIVALGDPRYPELLLQAADPPLLLYTIGRVELLQTASVAIVGSRGATPQGLENARSFAQQLSDRDLTIVSGLALGVDGAAHKGGLAGAASTIAFVGTGLDQVYPKRHEQLAERIAEQGLIASEYPLGMPPLPINFPRRNRLIAGVSLGTLVVEAALKSGSLITARMALDGGRDVFAIPGSIHAPQAHGCHRLIQEGAKLVESAPTTSCRSCARKRVPRVRRAWHGSSVQSSRRCSPWPRRTPSSSTASDSSGRDPPDDALLRAMGHDPVTFDALASRTGLPSDRLAARLLDLELDGAGCSGSPGGLLQRRAAA